MGSGLREPAEAAPSISAEAAVRASVDDSSEFRDRGGEPARIGRFTVLHRLGSGGMGLVFAAYDDELDRKVAIKLLRPQHGTSGRASLGQARLLREAQAMARLAHPNVVTVHEVGTFGSQVFIAMEFLSGVTLKTWLRQARRPWPEVVAVFVQAGRGLAAAHAAGLIHRDFKPDNVMVGEDPQSGRVERVRVFDFGVVQEVREAAQRQALGDSSDALARRTPDPDDRPMRRSSEGARPGALDRAKIHSLPAQGELSGSSHGDESLSPGLRDSLSDGAIGSLTAAGALVGTPMYMAPEQHQQVADARSDQFSFCVALFEALYRKRPFSGDTAGALQRAKLAGKVRRRPADSEVPMWLHQLVLRGLAADPARRFTGMDALLAELERDRGRARRFALAGVAFVAALAAGAATTLALAGADPCAGAASAVATAWNPARREAIHAAFAGSGRAYAEATFAAVDAALSRRAETWAGQRQGLCEAARVTPAGSPQLAARALCLDLRLQELVALSQLLARADGEVVDNAPAALGQLPPVDACEDAVALLGRLPPPPPPQVAASAERLAARLAEVRALERTGKYTAGLEGARAAVAEARRVDHGPLLAEALYLEGVLHARLSAIRAAEASLFEASLVAEASRHDEVVAQARLELVRVVGTEQERYDDGLRWGQLADAAVRRLGAAPEAAALRGNLGRLHQRRGDLQAAQRELDAAAKMAQETLPEDHPLRATALSDLAGLHLQQGRYVEAADGYERALALRRRVFGPDHPRVAEALGAVARVAWERQDLEQAHALYTEALRICAAHGGCSLSERAQAMVDLSRLEFARREYAAAERLAGEALSIYEAVYGPEHSRVGDLQMNLGVFAKNQGRLDEAQAHYERALQIQRLHHDEDHPTTTLLYTNLGTLAMERGEWASAREHFKAALGVHARLGNHESFGFANLLDNDGVAARRLGDAKAAIELHARALQVYRRDRGEAHPDVTRVRTHLAEAHLDAGQAARAAEIAESQIAAVGDAAGGPELAALRFVLARALLAGMGAAATPVQRARVRGLAEAALQGLQGDPAAAAEAQAIADFLARLPR